MECVPPARSTRRALASSRSASRRVAYQGRRSSRGRRGRITSTGPRSPTNLLRRRGRSPVARGGDARTGRVPGRATPADLAVPRRSYRPAGPSGARRAAGRGAAVLPSRWIETALSGREPGWGMQSIRAGPEVAARLHSDRVPVIRGPPRGGSSGSSPKAQTNCSRLGPTRSSCRARRPMCLRQPPSSRAHLDPVPPAHWPPSS